MYCPTASLTILFTDAPSTAFRKPSAFSYCGSKRSVFALVVVVATSLPVAAVALFRSQRGRAVVCRRRAAVAHLPAVDFDGARRPRSLVRGATLHKASRRWFVAHASRPRSARAGAQSAQDCRRIAGGRKRDGCRRDRRH